MNIVRLNIIDIAYIKKPDDLIDFFLNIPNYQYCNSITFQIKSVNSKMLTFKTLRQIAHVMSPTQLNFKCKNNNHTQPITMNPHCTLSSTLRMKKIQPLNFS